jgi:hypothetical protein
VSKPKKLAAFRAARGKEKVKKRQKAGKNLKKPKQVSTGFRWQVLEVRNAGSSTRFNWATKIEDMGAFIV